MSATKIINKDTQTYHSRASFAKRKAKRISKVATSISPFDRPSSLPIQDVLAPDRIISGVKVYSLHSYLRYYSGVFANGFAYDRVISILERSLKGLKVDFRSPLCFLVANKYPQFKVDNDFRAAAIKLWDILFEDDKDFNTIIEFKEFELSQREKIGTFSVIPPFEERVDGVLPHFKPSKGYDSTKINHGNLDVAVNRIKLLIPKGSLYMSPLSYVVELAIKSTNWCIPFCVKGKELIDGVPAWQEYAKLAEIAIERKVVPFYPAFELIRTTAAGLFPKTRVVWAYSKVVGLIEAMIFEPTFATLRVLPPFVEWNGREVSDIGITESFRYAFIKGCSLIGIDFSQYDATICRELIVASFDVLRYWFVESDHWAIDGVQECILNVDLITPFGVFVGKNKGMPSGSGLTNLIDSLVQMIIVNYATLQNGLDLDDVVHLVNGDDGILVLPGMTPTLFSESLTHLGVSVNPSKCTYSKDYVVFCQRLYSINFPTVDGRMVGIRSAYRTLNSMLGYERKRPQLWNDRMDTVRWIMQLEEMSYNPIFKKIIREMILLDDRYGLGTKYPGGVQSLIKSIGGPETVVELASGSSWELKRSMEMAVNLINLNTVKEIESYPLSFGSFVI